MAFLRAAKALRFRRALGQLQSAGPVRLTDVALDAQYCDQAHMNAEFRALGGITPRAFLAAPSVVRSVLEQAGFRGVVTTPAS